MSTTGTGSALGAGAGPGPAVAAAPATVATLLQTSNQNVIRFRGMPQGKNTYKRLQLYNYDASRQIDWNKMSGDQNKIAQEIQCRLNTMPENKEFRCHAKSLLNKQAAVVADHPLYNHPIKDDEPFFFKVRPNSTTVGGRNSIYFNLDFYLPERGLGLPNEIRELCHISFHTSPDEPLYLLQQVSRTSWSRVQPLQVDVTKASPHTQDGVFHMYESAHISDHPKTFARYVLNKVEQGGKTRFEILLVGHFEKDKYTAPFYDKMHPFSTLFARTVIDVIQQYLDEGYSTANFNTKYYTSGEVLSDKPSSNFKKIAKKNIPNKANSIAIPLEKASLPHFDLNRLNSQPLLDEFLYRLNSGPLSSKIKAQASEVANITLQPSILKITHSLSRTRGGITLKIILSIHGSGQLQNITFITITDDLPADVFDAPSDYKGMFRIQDLDTDNEMLRYKVVQAGATKKVERIFQIGTLKSVTIHVADVFTTLLEEFINSGYNSSGFHSPYYYDCDGVASNAPVSVPAFTGTAPYNRRYGGRRTRSQRRKKRATRKNKKRT
jgi:hypothetical protein